MSTLAAALSSRRFRSWMPVVSALVLVAGVVAAVIAFNVGGIRNTARSQETPISNVPAQVYREPKRVPLDPAARVVAGRFIKTAVARKNLDAAWSLVGAQLRAGMTRAEWAKGDIPVVPFLGPIGVASIKVDESHRNDALLEVLIVPKGKGKAQVFFMGLQRVGHGRQRHWVVTSWSPRANIAVPATAG